MGDAEQLTIGDLEDFLFRSDMGFFKVAHSVLNAVRRRNMFPEQPSRSQKFDAELRADVSRVSKAIDRCTEEELAESVFIYRMRESVRSIFLLCNALELQHGEDARSAIGGDISFAIDNFERRSEEKRAHSFHPVSTILAKYEDLINLVANGTADDIQEITDAVSWLFQFAKGADFGRVRRQPKAARVKVYYVLTSSASIFYEVLFKLADKDREHSSIFYNMVSEMSTVNNLVIKGLGCKNFRKMASCELDYAEV
jgi:hypothetical protein